MSSLSAREKTIRQRLKDDFTHYAPRCLKIRTKSGDVIPFELNRSQRFLHEKLEAQLSEIGKVRALVLKGRQCGISTYVAGRYYWRISHTRGQRAFILTHLDDASTNLFGFAKRFHDHCPALVKPVTGASNAKELSFVRLDSGYKVATAGNQDVGRSETIQFFHGSEVAFWPNAESHSAGIKQAIADVDGTEDIRESTANGIGNAFHKAWKQAERGESEYQPIFIPWFWHEEYIRQPPRDWAPPEAWEEYQQAYGLDINQIYWAWHKNRELIATAGGTSDAPCWQFKQEYPGNADEAFQTSGDSSFISPELVLRARKANESVYGPVILGVDPAYGGGDKTAIIDRQGRKVGAGICELWDESDTMVIAAKLQRIIQELKPMKVCIDVGGGGKGIIDRLRELFYGKDIIEAVNFGAKAYQDKRYVNRRSEMWDSIRLWLEDKAGVDLPDRDDLHGDLCAPIRGSGATRLDSHNRLVLEPKDKIKERLGASPDLGDALALTFAVDLSTAEDVDWGYEPQFQGTSGAWLGA